MKLLKVLFVTSLVLTFVVSVKASEIDDFQGSLTMEPGNWVIAEKLAKAIEAQGGNPLDSLYFYTKADAEKNDVEAQKRITNRLRDKIGQTLPKPLLIIDGWMPSWSPVDHQFAYVTYSQKEFVLAIANLNSQPRYIGKLSSGRPYFGWNKSGEKIAYGSERKLIVYDLNSNTSREFDLPNEISSPLVWSNDDRYIAFKIGYNDPRRLYIFDLGANSSTKFEVVGYIVGWSISSSQVILISGDKLISIDPLRKTKKQIGLLPSDRIDESLALRDNFPLVWATEPTPFDGYTEIGNQVLFSTIKNSKLQEVIFSSKRTKADSTRIANTTRGLVFLQSSGISRDLFRVLWIASTSGSEKAIIDYGEINLSDNPFSADGSMLAYSKGVQDSKIVVVGVNF